jgi:hypothetical protein
MLTPVTSRSLHLGPVLGTGAHHGFELAAGVGLVFQPYLGLKKSAAIWGVSLPGWAYLAVRRGRPAVGGTGGAVDKVLALLAGVSLAGSLLHFKLWPVAWRPEGRRIAVPVLIEAEGLSPRQLPAYNAILYGWAAASLAAVAAGSPRGTRRYAAAGLLAGFPLAASARHHFKWLRAQAEEHPAWWNRAGRAVETADG